jgi:hypothetical protein
VPATPPKAEVCWRRLGMGAGWESLDRPLEETGAPALVDLRAQAVDLAFRDAGHPNQAKAVLGI